jgi:predicted RNA-binding Zn ribbon-like protein
MYFNHYTNRPVELAVLLVNTCQSGSDQMTDPEELDDLLNGYRDLWEGVAQPPKASELGAIHDLRTSLRTVMLAPNDATASQRVNQILSDYGAVPRISMHSGEPHLHFEPINGTMTSWLGTTTAMGLAAVIVENGVDRFGACNSGDCDDVYVDTSRNRSRRHCSTTCSTREAVAAHRKRKVEGNEPASASDRD